MWTSGRAVAAAAAASGSRRSRHSAHMSVRVPNDGIMSVDHSVNLDTGNRWSAYKRLYKVLSNVVSGSSGGDTSELESILRKHKPDFISLMKNPVSFAYHLNVLTIFLTCNVLLAQPRSSLHRDAILQSVKDGITVVQNGHRSRKIVPKTVVEEAVLLSEMFDLNELVALELLITGDHQLPRYPGAARGPVAVLLYMDSRKSLLHSLKTLLQCVGGRTWAMTASPDVSSLIHSFLTGLIQEGVIDRALQNLQTFDSQKEIELLQKNRAFGPGKFKRQVIDIIKEIEELHSYILMAYAAQFGIAPKATTELIRIISELPCIKSNSKLDAVATNLILAVLFNLDTASFHTSDGGIEQLPLVKHDTLLNDVYRCVQNLNSPQLKTLLTLTCSVVAKTVNTMGSESLESLTIGLHEDTMFDEAVDGNVFDAIANLLVDNPHLYTDEFNVLRIHSLLTDLPCVFPLKLKELRDKGDESGRMIFAYISEGVRPPTNLSRSFEKFLLLLANFYADENNSCAPEIWKGNDPAAPHKYTIVNKFIRSTVETYSPQILHFSILKLLSSFATKAPFQIFSLLKSSASHHNPQFSLDHLFKSIQAYGNSLRGVQTDATFILQSDAGKSSQTTNTTSDSEIDLFCAFLYLISNIVREDKTCAQAIAENHQYNCFPTFVSLISGPIPRKLRASLLSCLSAFASSSPVVALNVWLNMEFVLPHPQLAVSFHSSQGQKASQKIIPLDIEDIEPRNEDYAVTMSFVSVVQSLLPHVMALRDNYKQEMTDHSVSFVVNSIFLKIESRVFKHEKEKWEAVFSCLQVILTVLQSYDPETDEQVLRCAFNLMQQFLQENVLFRGILNIVEAVVAHLEPEAKSALNYKDDPVIKMQEKCLLLALQILHQVLQKSGDYFCLVRRLAGFPSAVLTPAATLFCNVNPRTGETDRLSLLVRLTAIPSPDIQKQTLAIFQSLVKQESSISYLTLLQCQPFKKYHEDYLLHGFVDCIESDFPDLRKGVIGLLLDLLTSENFSSGYYGLAHKLMGFDRKMQLRVPGSCDQSFTCFHSIIAIIESDPDPHHLEERKLSMQVLLQVCANSETRSTVLRFIRTSYDLLVNYMNQRSEWLHGSLPVASLPEVSCFWRLLAAEIKTAQDSELVSHTKHYMQLLLGNDMQSKFPALVPASVYTHSQPEMPVWEFFDGNELWKSITACSADGSVNVKLLHMKLMSEVTQYTYQYGTAQSNLYTNEIKKILSFVEQLNASHQMLQTKVDFFKGWRDLVETVISCDCLELAPDATKGLLLLDLIHTLARQSSDVAVIPALMVPISSVTLIATSRLSSCEFVQTSSTHLLATCKALTGLLEGCQSNELWNRFQRARINFYGALLHVYRAMPNSSGRKLSKRLVSKLSRDSLDSIDLVKVLSLSILQESDTCWVDDLGNDGTLQLLISSLTHDDREIRANKCQKLSKSFYTFESKMSLLTKLASTEKGARILVHLGIVPVLSGLECIEVYTYLLNQNEVCFCIFEAVFRLLVELCQSCPPSDGEELSRFVVAKSPVLYGMLRTTESYRETAEGQKVLFHVSALLSKLILFTNQELQKTFFAFTNVCMDARKESEAKILLNLLQGCVTYIRSNRKLRFATIDRTNIHVCHFLKALTPLFLPAWERGEGLSAIGQPTMGVLLRVIEQNVDKCKEGKVYVMIVESALYLLLNHINLYSIIVDTTPDEDREIQRLKDKIPENLTTNFFTKIQHNIQVDIMMLHNMFS